MLPCSHLGRLRRLLPLLLAALLALSVLPGPASAASAPTAPTAATASDDGRAARAPRHGTDLLRAARAPGTVPGLPADCLGSAQRCEIGPQRRGAPTVVLWGDSHAWQVLAAVRSAIGKRRVNVVAFLYGGCPPFAPGLKGPRQVRAAGGCQKTNYRAQRYVRAQHRRAERGRGPAVRVVLAAGWELYRYARAPLAEGEPGWRQHTAPSIQGAAGMHFGRGPKLFAALGRAGVPADVVGQMPTVPANAPACAAGERPYACDLRRAAVLADAKANRAYVRSLRGRLPRSARLVEPTRGFCSTSGCPGRVRGVATYYDDTHISPELSATLGRFFAPTIDRLLRADRR